MPIPRNLKYHLEQLHLLEGSNEISSFIRTLDATIKEAMALGRPLLLAVLYRKRASAHQKQTNYVEAIGDLVAAAEQYKKSRQPLAALNVLERAWSLSKSERVEQSSDLRAQVARARSEWAGCNHKDRLAAFRDQLWWGRILPGIRYGQSLSFLSVCWLLLVVAISGAIFLTQKYCGGNATYTFPQAFYVGAITFFGFGFFESDSFNASTQAVVLVGSLIGVPFTALFTAVMIGKLTDE